MIHLYKVLKKLTLYISKYLLFLVYMNRIKEVLEDKGIKQTWLAEKLGKSFNMVNGYVQNRHQPSLETLYKIAEILNVSVKDLLVDNDENRDEI